MQNKIINILVIDDDTRLRNLLAKFLEENNFAVSVAKDTNEAREKIAVIKFDLLIVDVMLPNETGIDFTIDIRKNSQIPIIILTARGEPDERIIGLESGADDYMPKPFEPKELLLRINNILKRNTNKNNRDNICLFGNFNFNLEELRLKKDDNFIHLTESEANILKILCLKKGQAVSREELSKLCGDVDFRSIDVQITRLRRKIEINPKQPSYIQTVRNFGYVFYD